MKTRGDVVPALPFFNATHFLEYRRTLPLLSEHQVKPIALAGIEMLWCRHSKPTHSPTAVLGMCEHIGGTSCAQVPQKPIRLILALLSYRLDSSKENSDAEN